MSIMEIGEYRISVSVSTVLKKFSQRCVLGWNYRILASTRLGVWGLLYGVRMLYWF